MGIRPPCEAHLVVLGREHLGGRTSRSSQRVPRQATCTPSSAGTEVKRARVEEAPSGSERGRKLVDAMGLGTRDSSNEVAGERRLITILFCDLVGSTMLSQRLDQEDYAELVLSY